MELGKELKDNRLDFALAGAAIFTLKSLKTGAHYTYSIKKGKVRYFASVRHGDNWIGIGSFRIDCPDLKTYPHDSPSLKGLKWFFNNPDSDQVEFYHMGKCAACGRALTNPESIETGFGPVCAGRI